MTPTCPVSGGDDERNAEPTVAIVNKHLLILDIDETLVFATSSPLERPPDFQAGPYAVYRRPHLSEFLKTVTDWFDIAVWSSGGASYVDAVVEQVFPIRDLLRFVWASDRCTRRLDPETAEYYWRKDLKKVRRAGHRLERVLMLDDSPEKLETNYGNHILLKPFTGDLSDTELLDVLPFLDSMRGVGDVRKAEKRHWRTFKSSTPRSESPTPSGTGAPAPSR